MPQSLKATTFDYTDVAPWNNYFNIEIRNFAEQAKALHEFRQEIVRKCKNLPYDELQEQWDYSQVLLGGVDKNGEYRERSLAKLYKELLGLRFENIKEGVDHRFVDRVKRGYYEITEPGEEYLAGGLGPDDYSSGQ